MTFPILASPLSVEFLLHILCWFYFSVGSFSYTSLAAFFFKTGEFLLHIPCWIHFSAGSFSDTYNDDFFLMWGVSLTHPVLPSFLCGEFLLHIPCCLDFYRSFSYTSRALSFSLFF